ncbi:MAG TPA: transposase [Vicinamibacterales bacterium]|nr:transposase [Vicinamibacterales bacterium]
MYNRRTDRQLLFPSAGAFDAFLDLMEEAVDRFAVRICAYCVMKTHWHQAIWVTEDGGTAVVRYLQWLSGTHAVRFRIASRTRGLGHVYQDRYNAKAVTTPAYYFQLVRYIEANPVSAGLVQRAEEWEWSSLAERTNYLRRILSDGPIPLPTNWIEIVNAGFQPDGEIAAL